MPHFAKLDENNIVTFVSPGRVEDDGRDEELSARTGDVYRQTSFNTRGGIHYDPVTGEPSEDQGQALRFNYAGAGMTYDPDRDAFIAPQFYPSWVLDEATCLWVAPVAYPDDGKMYTWDETTTAGREVDNELD